MSAGVLLGIIFSVATALTAIIGFLLKHRGATESPPIEVRRPVRSSLALFRSGWYVVGITVAMASWGFHVAGLALAPISLVQSVIAGGLVFLTVCADRIFGLQVSRREWVGVTLAAVGLAVLAATLEGGARDAHSDFETPPLLTYVAIAAIAGVAAAIWARRGPNGGPLLGASAGLLWGASDVCIKALSDSVDQGVAAVLTDPLVLIVIGASLVGLTVSARSLQVGPPVAVIAITSAAANTCTILSGPIIFGEPFPDDSAGVILRCLAFALVIGAAALTPPPRLEHADGT